MLAIAGLIFLPSQNQPTGAATFEQETSSIHINKTFNESTTIELTELNFTNTSSLKISGKIKGESARIYADTNNTLILVFDSSTIKNNTISASEETASTNSSEEATFFSNQCIETCNKEMQSPKLTIVLRGNTELTITNISYSTQQQKGELKQTKQLPDIEIIGDATINLSEFFTETNNAPISYAITQIHDVRAIIFEDTLKIFSRKKGNYAAQIIATNGPQMLASNQFSIIVGEKPESKIEDEVEKKLELEEEISVILELNQTEFAKLQHNTKSQLRSQKENLYAQHKIKRAENAQNKNQAFSASEKTASTNSSTEANSFFNSTMQKDYDYKIEKEYESLPLIAVRLTKQGIEKLRNDSSISAVYLDKNMTISLQESIPIVKADIAQNLSYANEQIKGQGQTACILDTGIDSSHTAFKNRILAGKNFIANNDNTSDDNGHGTHAAGIIGANGTLTGVAPKANILPIKVCDANGNCPSSAILAGIDYCLNKTAEQNISVISGSFADEGEYNNTNCPTIFDSALNAANEQNVTNVFASGNNFYRNGISYPACSPFSIAVGASTKQDTLAMFTNKGNLLDILAPGSDITSTLPDNNYGAKSGTSMSTAFVAGTIALIAQKQKLQNFTLSPAQIKQLLKETAEKNIEGIPRLDAYNAISKAGNITLNATIKQLNQTSNGTGTTIPPTSFEISAQASIDSVILNSTNGNNQTYENLTAYPVNPVNGTEINYDWRIKGVSIAMLNLPMTAPYNNGTRNVTFDFSQSNVVGVMNNTAPVWNASGVEGGSYTFNGTNVIDFPNIPNFRNGTFSFWISPSSWPLTGDRDVIFTFYEEAEKEQFDTHDKNFFLNTTGQIKYRIFDGGTKVFGAKTALTIGQWSFVVTTTNSTESAIYINGVKEATLATAISFGYSNPAARIAGIPSTVSDSETTRTRFNGSIDQFVLYNRILTAAQIQAIYNGSAPKYNRLVPGELGPAGSNWTVIATPIDSSGLNGTGVRSNHVILANASSCARINKTQTLFNNVSSGNSCFDFNQSNIVFDCARFSITANPAGIIAFNISKVNNAQLENITIKNCIVNNFSVGINISNAKNITLINVTVINSTLGIGVNNTVTLTTSNLNVSNNGIFGVLLDHVTNASFFNFSINKLSGTSFTAINSSVLLNDSFVGNYSFELSNLTVETQNGIIEFTRNITQANNTNLTGLTRPDINISFNSTFVNTTDKPGFNVTANLTFFGLTGFTTPQAIVSFADTTTFEACGPTICTTPTYVSATGLVKYQVTQFTRFAVNETPSAGGNTPPTINKVWFDNPVTPQENVKTGFNITINFTANDADGAADLVDASALANITNQTWSYLNSPVNCTVIANNATSRNYSCQINISYYFPAGIWNISVNITDTEGTTGANKTEQFTLNELTAITLNTSQINFDKISVSTGDQRANNSLGIDNTGNVNITTLDFKAFDVWNSTGPGFTTINASNFTVSVHELATGPPATLRNNTLVTLTNSSVPVDSSAGDSGNRTFYFFINVSSILPGQYNASRLWEVSPS